LELGARLNFLAGILEQFIPYLSNIITSLGYPGLFLIMVGKTVVPIVPSEIVMPFAGFVAAEGALTFMGVLLASTAGAVLGASIVYYLAAKIEVDDLKGWIRKYGRYILMKEEDLDKTLQRFERNRGKAIVSGIMLPGARYLIPIPAGLENMRFASFLFYTTIGWGIWNTILMTGGYFLGRRWEEVLEIVGTYELIIFGILGGLLLIFIGRRLYRKIFSTN
jgi:membrane protein DedA with SNARE-associated domain